MAGVRGVGRLIAVAVVGTVLVGCSSGGDEASGTVSDGASPMGLAEELVASDLSEAVGLGPLVPSCADPGPLAVGVTFGCTGTTESGQVIQIQGIINVEGRIQLVTTNFITPLALTGLERDAAANLNQTIGSNFTADSVDCGAGPIIVPEDLVLPCALMMPSSGQVFDLALTITNLDTREFSLVVADAPRA